MNERAPTAATAEIVAELVRSELRALSAYAVARAEGMIKLDAMENPYALPAAVAARLGDALARVPINRYPDGAAEDAKRALRQALAIPDAHGLLLGNGSDELIQLIASTLARPGATMLIPEPSFVMYRMSALNTGLRVAGVSLNGDFSLNLQAMLDAIEREHPALVFLAYPNNPTGNLFAASEVEAILRATPGLVVVDEAYYAFAEASFLSRVGEFRNLLVLRTLSKVGMAGIRLGYAVAPRDWIDELNKLRPPYNVNAFTQAAIGALLADTAWIAEQAAAIRAERARLQAAMARLPGVQVYPTQTNFIVARFSKGNDIFEGLKAKRILIKNLDGWHPLLARCLRITVGTPSENDMLLSALAELTDRP
ncbi:MAG: histidinol-phosphate transaminase [Betaproteobacteria bacterium]|nr:MAG: histidinol-phosphate transaminase [Betaproteobacteria bacterium]